LFDPVEDPLDQNTGTIEVGPNSTSALALWAGSGNLMLVLSFTAFGPEAK
jgi:hypothetical protein